MQTRSLLVRNVLLEGKPGDILMRGEKIEKIAPNIPEPADRVLDGRGLIALPPLMNAHTHCAMALLRGYADDMRLQEWLETKIWPLEAKLTEHDVYLGARLGCLEMIRSGCTFFNDMYWRWHGTAKAVEEMGLRAAIAPVFIDLGDDAKTHEQRKLNEKLLSERRSSRITFTLGPHAIYTVSEANLRWNRSFAEANSLLIHLHLSETEREVQDCIRATGKRPVHYLESIGFLGPDVIAAHCVHLTHEECRILTGNGVKPVHIPVSNLKLAVGGVMPYTTLRNAGAQVLLGTDGCSSNNNLDMFETMKFAALIQKHASNDPTCLPAPEAWEMATSRTADAFGLNIGRIEEGRDADLILVNPDDITLAPGYCLPSDLVYSASGACVDTTICAGRVLMHKGRVRGQDAIIAEAREAARRLTGLSLTPRFASEKE